ncbi:uncharacterized protein LOC133802389 [Humulus lupulus]|uniref:uncharacterized protein LOC133802389 n=1 Tax=Humulus lupulus TaxID=3486 RepID=UPI002B400721|nr:uncharacterized protein LOC133802389 [Humulus lupulus]
MMGDEDWFDYTSTLRYISRRHDLLFAAGNGGSGGIQGSFSPNQIAEVETETETERDSSSSVFFRSGLEAMEMKWKKMEEEEEYEEQRKKALNEESRKQQAETAHEGNESDEGEYEEGPAEIIWMLIGPRLILLHQNLKLLLSIKTH